MASSERARTDGLILDIARLLRWPGNQCDVVVDHEPRELATTAATARTVRGTLLAEAMADSLSVTGDLEVGWEGECRRCLGPASGMATVELQEIFERDPTEGETYELTDDRLDLEPAMRELVLLSLPLAPLCSEDCLGPAPEVFPATVETDPADTDSSSVATDADTAPGRLGDPRWAALDALVFPDETREPASEDEAEAGPD